MARSTDIFTFDPYATQDDNSIFTEATIYDGLVRLAPDGRTIQPALATKWSISANGKTARFTLRKGVEFSNGTPLTSKDVAWSLRRDADPKGSWGFLFAPVSNVTADGPSTVTIHMKSAFAPPAGAHDVRGEHLLQSQLRQVRKGFWSTSTGHRAVRSEKWTKGVSLELKRNTHYWEPGKPHLDGIKFTVVGDDNSKILQLQSGQVDVVDKVPPNLLSKLRANPQVKVQEINGTAVGWITINEK
jgi:peptide/nickel transport system substrate-binding protein